jgi:hypothetical protein
MPRGVMDGSLAAVDRKPPASLSVPDPFTRRLARSLLGRAAHHAAPAELQRSALVFSPHPDVSLRRPNQWSTWRNFRAPSITKHGYHNLPFCYSRAIAYFFKTAMLINRRRFSAEHFHRFFRGRDSMKWNEESCRSYFGDTFGCPYLWLRSPEATWRLNSAD